MKDKANTLVSNKNLLVMKIGGTSVANISRIKNMALKIKHKRENGFNIVVVVSAMGQETDRLENLARSITPQPDKREMDMLLTVGERISMSLLAMALIELKIPAISFTGSQSGIITDTHHNRAKIVTILPTRLEAELRRGKVIVAAGFQGVSRMKEVTTLGRGGSDTTAVALAVALKASKCEIYTDVKGVFTLDPRFITVSQEIDAISYNEMIEFAGAGCKIIDPRAVIFAKKFNVPLWIGSSLEEERGTIITSPEEINLKPILGVAVNEHELITTLVIAKDYENKSLELLKFLAENNVPVEIISQRFTDLQTIDFTIIYPEEDSNISNDAIEKIRENENVKDVIQWKSLARVSLIGKGMKGVPGVLRKMLLSLNEISIPVYLITTTDLRISVFIPRRMIETAVNAIVTVFELN